MLPRSSGAAVLHPFQPPEYLATPLGASPATRIAGGAMLGDVRVQLMWPCLDGYASVSFLFGSAFGPFTQNLMEWVY